MSRKQSAKQGRKKQKKVKKNEILIRRVFKNIKIIFVQLKKEKIMFPTFPSTSAGRIAS